jgi:hypothetical protein
MASEGKFDGFESMKRMKKGKEKKNKTGHTKVVCRNGDYAFRQVRCLLGYRNRAFPALILL